MPPHALIHTDGACLGTAALRPGGWAALILVAGEERVIAGSHPATTITAMELTAAVRALEAVPAGSSVTLRTDSAALVAGITERLPWWRSRGWRTVKGRKVPERGLWQVLAALAAERQVAWVWVKAHAGDPGNERADALARAEAYRAAGR
jgi:ribonuclease HI